MVDMRMKLLSTVVAAAAFMAVTSASAAITVSATAYKTYAQDVADFAQSGVLCDFEGPNCIAGYNFAFAGGSAPGTGLFTGNVAGISAAPPGDGTQYASVLGPNGVATLTFTTLLPGISFFMGSPDEYNSIEFFVGGTSVGLFNGSQFTGPPANGDQSLGERISFNFNGAAVDSIRFTSTQNSFEFDRLGLSVPEPTTWAMMLLGFGGIGAMIRRRRQTLATA
jgi:hypothetical protein